MKIPNCIQGLELTHSIQVEFMGTLKRIAGKKKITLDFHKPVQVQEVITELVSTLPLEFGRFLIDPELNDPRPNVLIILNKTEIGALDGLDTKVRNNDKLIIVPVVHGG